MIFDGGSTLRTIQAAHHVLASMSRQMPGRQPEVLYRARVVAAQQPTSSDKYCKQLLMT